MRLPDPPNFQASDAIHQGSAVPDVRMHAHMPMPQIDTGHLVVDPEIELKAKKFNLAISLFYSSATSTATEFGVGRTASIRAYIEDGSGAYTDMKVLNRGDWSNQYFSMVGTTGSVSTFVSSTNTGNITTLSYDSSVTGGEYTEYFNTGMQLKYRLQGGKHRLFKVQDADGVAQTYVYGSGVEENYVKSIEVPG
ncbi:MAG TPA: hypothetical protein PKA27_17595, partial [Fimbriimonadaceae bacterium]|nr:hypothetical protein [Fimbriimonadaceae bacterium]